MSSYDVLFDHLRADRIGLSEAVFCAGKSTEQIAHTLREIAARDASVLLTLLAPEKLAALPEELFANIDYCATSQTAFFGPPVPVVSTDQVAIVAAGTSDASVAREAHRTLLYSGVHASLFVDVGVAGLWRLMERVEDIRRHPIVIVVAGMDAALASVLGGLVSGALIAVPTSVGYGAAEDGRTALNAMLSSCAPGVTVCNIDNGYGGASAALRILHAITAPKSR